MKALSFSQPWLWSILHAGKRVENRPWSPPRAQLPLRIALHAAKSWDKDAPSFFLELDLTDFPARRDMYPAAAIVGVATVTGWVDRLVADPDNHPDLEPDQRRWFFGPYGWLLRDVRAIATPIPILGKLGLWDVPADITAALSSELGEDLR